ncbi:hypothetical protein LPJ81_006215, partial [Coemansia sp. IMI 209127]
MVFIEEDEQQQQAKPAPGPVVHKSNTETLLGPNGTAEAGQRSATFGGSSGKEADEVQQPSAPASPFTAGSGISAQSHGSHQSYAHRRSVSGWDKLFTTILQRSATQEPNVTDLELRVPGIGEDALAHGDVQYVYESDENIGKIAFTSGGQSGQPQSRKASASHPTTPFAAIAHRDRANTGASSTGSGLQFDHGPTTSTTALSPAFGMASVADEHAAAAAAAAAVAGISIGVDNSGKLVGSFIDERTSEHRHHGHFPHLRSRKSSTSMLSHREKTQHHDGMHHHGTGAVLGRLFGPSGGEGEIDEAHEEPGDDEDNAIKRKRMEDLRSKLKRAVVMASAITRKTPRSMKSAGAQGVFPFLQDAMFVPMFHFMRDEHGHRAPP